MIRKPDDVVWSWPWISFCVGWTVQGYSWDAVCLTVCLGPLTLRWHWR